MEGLVGDIVSAKFDIPKALINAKVLTKKLNDNAKAVRESDPTVDTKALRDDATAFAKVCLSPCFSTDLGMTNLVLCWFRVSDGDFIMQCLQESWNRKTLGGRPTSENDPSHECD